MRLANAYKEVLFRRMVDNALGRVKTILDTTRNPRLPHEAEEDHTYDDKYALAEFLTNTGIAAKMNALERLGLDAEKLGQLVLWVHKEKQSVTLRLEASDSCQFLKENVVDLSTEHTSEVETTGPSFLGKGKSSKTRTVKTKVTTKVKEYHWKVELKYRLILFKGADAEGTALELQSRTASAIIVTSGGQQTTAARASGARPTPPLEEATVHPNIDVNLTWFFQCISPKVLECQFSIDRESVNAHKTCKTPRRNRDVDRAVQFDKELQDWTGRVHNFFVNHVEHRVMDKHKPVAPFKNSPVGGAEAGSVATIEGLDEEPTFNGQQVRILKYDSRSDRYRVEPVDTKASLPGTLIIKSENLKPVPGDGTTGSQKGLYLEDITGDGIFGPVIPLMENGTILSIGDVASLLNEQNRSLDEAIDNLTKTYPPRTLMKLVSVAEATVVLVCLHLQLLTQQCTQGIDYIEDMLKQQLIQAIGKEVTSEDFDQFMRFHNQKFFGGHYAPLPFTYAIRRPNHYPDGVLSIEAATEKRELIETWVRHIPNGSPMFMRISAATLVELNGDRYLHGWMQNRFNKTHHQNIELVARARQFSSFLLVVGAIAGPDKFDPKDAIILQNKDEVLIPLLTNTIPSAKEFKDAIASLSPEQQQFAKAFRSMQLESSVFGVCVIQIKPQLERLLGLPDGALTKEMQLTQDLLSLFVEYQIPSDLLTFEGDESSALTEKVAAVKGFVKSVMDVIEGEKKKQLEEETRKADMREELDHSRTLADEFDQYKDTSLGPSSHHASFGSEIESACAEIPMMNASAVALETKDRSLFSGPSLRKRGRQKLARWKMPITAAVPQAKPMTRASLRSVAVQEQQQQQQQTRHPQQLQLQTTKSLSSLPKNHPEQEPPAEQTQDGTRGSRDHPSSAPRGENLTLIPRILDSKLETFDTEGALCTTIIKASQDWTRKRQENLLTKVMTSALAKTVIETEKNKAFDLLDAISRSGALPIGCAELHVVIGVSHCFENDIMGTIIQDNINPINKVEKSALLLASTIYGEPAAKLIAQEEDVARLTDSFPEVMGIASAPANDDETQATHHETDLS